MLQLLKLILELGIDVSNRAGIKTALKLLGKEDGLADEVYILLKNYLNYKGFSKVPYKDRFLFLPQCLRNSKECKAELTETGYICKECGKCCILKLKKEAENLGYSVFILPGSSMAMKIISEYAPKAILGVACKYELCEIGEKLTSKIWLQGIHLLKTGCKDTEVDIENVIKSMKQS